MKTYPLEYLYESPYYQKRGTARYGIITFPEIFGLNTHAEIVTDRFCEIFSLPSYGLDFFYALTKKHNDLPYKAVQDGIELMNQMSDKLFLDLLSQAKSYITLRYPTVEQFIICGFCFGGRLALLAGGDPDVSHIISFYGARSNIGLQDGELSPIEHLATRTNPSSLSVLNIFGSKDDSISAEMRGEISRNLESANIDSTECVYDAGHAFFNSHRPTYNPHAARMAWSDLTTWLLTKL